METVPGVSMIGTASFRIHYAQAMQRGFIRKKEMHGETPKGVKTVLSVTWQEIAPNYGTEGNWLVLWNIEESAFSLESRITLSILESGTTLGLTGKVVFPSSTIRFQLF